MSIRVVESTGPVREQVSEAEWQTRVDLAAAYRLITHMCGNDLTYNHLSARVPGEPEHLLIKPATVMFEEVTASGLFKYDLDGNPLMEGTPHLKGGGLVIHAGIMKARPDINAVFHTHTPAVMGVSAQKKGLRMLNQHAMRFYNRIAYHEFGGFEFNLDQREPLIEALGDRFVGILRNHGALVCGVTVGGAFVTHHFLEMSCRGQIAALAGGAEVDEVPPEICEKAVQQVAPDDSPKVAEKDWDACLRMAERLDPGFRD